MKRGLILAGAALAAAAFATPAQGATTLIYFGNDQDRLCGQFFTADCHVRFFGKASRTRVRKVTGFTYTGIPIQCDQGVTAISDFSDSGLPAMKVNRRKRKFVGHFSNSFQRVDVTGKFPKGYADAHGTLRIRGNYDANHTNCETGVDRYFVDA